MRLFLLVLSSIFIFSGCVVRTYKVTKDRVDQNLTAGNRGYLQGEAPAREGKERKTTRTTQVVELELHPIVKFEKFPKQKPVEITEEDQEVTGNRGYIMQSQTPVIREPVVVAKIEKYTVQKGDTLQKISKKFYGTSKKWTKIYEANKVALRGPDKIYPGQAINIPTNE